MLPTVLPSDPRYGELSHSDNHRFAVTPDEFVMPRTPDEVIEALAPMAAANSEVACRSGGHCGQNFVGAPRRRRVIDLVDLCSIAPATGGRGVRVEAGATVDMVQKRLYRQWGAALPLGACSAVGMGGLVAGGGYGALSRRLGLTVDHLAAVEVVVVDERGRPRLVRATAQDDGDLGDLFWAHTGGGGGNFGIVCAYEFAAPDHLIGTPVGLPRAADRHHVRKLVIPWPTLDESGFVTLLRRFFEWHEKHSTPGAAETSVFGTLFARHRSAQVLELMVQQEADDDPDGRLLAAFLDEVTEGLVAIPRGGTMSWLTATRYMSQADCGDVMGARSASKSAYHRSTPSDDQLAVMHRHLSDDHLGPASYVMVNSYGGEINRRPTTATAIPQRDSVAKSSWFTGWIDPTADDTHLGWLRGLYEDFFAATGGVPVTGGATDGCYINYPDLDLLDQHRNRSGQSWQQLCYKQNHERLRRAKQTWDPGNVFHHSMSIAP